MATARGPNKWDRKKTHVLVMTPGTRGPRQEEEVVRIDRVPKSQLDLSNCQYTSNGPLTGIVINKKVKVLPQVKPADIELDFTAYMFNINNKANKKQEDSRLLRFWFIPGAPSKAKQREHAQAYFKLLIKPERFPTEYASFIKKVLQLARHFPTISRLELVIRPPYAKSPTAHNSSEDEENIVEVARQRRNRANARRSKWAKIDQSLSEDEDDEPGDTTLDTYITVFTPAKYDYVFLPGIQINRRPFFTFRVKAKCDVYVALSSKYGDTEHGTYEILIGGWNNTKSVIRDGSKGRILEEVETPKILDKLTFRSFWIRWGRRFMEVGLGQKLGQKIFLRCFIPSKAQYHINSLGVSTGPGSAGQWELVERIVELTQREKDDKEAFYSYLCKGLMFEAKKRSILEFLGDAYPSRLNTANLRRMSKTRAKDVMMIVTILKSLAESGDVIQVQKGVWILSHFPPQRQGYGFEVVDKWPIFVRRDSPTLIVLTTRECEKLAVDAMMDNKTTFVQNLGKGAVYAFTIGRMDGRVTMHVNLSEPFNPHSKSCLSGILGHFRTIHHAFLIGVGGAVPHYTDYYRHVRLGDVVVSLPVMEKRPIYVQCDKVGHVKFGRHQFGIDVHWMTDDLLQGHVMKARDMGESRTSTFRKTFNKHLDRGIHNLSNTRFDFKRPPLKTDKLFGYIDGDYVPIEHPKPQGWFDESSTKAGQSNFRFGSIGSGKAVVKKDFVRMDFSNQYGVAAFDSGCLEVLDIIQKSGIDNSLVIRGMADYTDGTTKKRWQPHASLCAAAYLKTFLTIIPKDRY